MGHLAGLPSARRIASGSHRIAAAAMPATIWFLDRVPEVAAGHRVRVAGVEIPVAELAARAVGVRARLDCTSGWYADAEWSGVSLGSLIPPDRRVGADSILVTSVTGYRRRFPIEEADDLWLATAVEGRPCRWAPALPFGWSSPTAAVSGGSNGWPRSTERDSRVRPVPFPLQYTNA